ncbi:MAG: DNA repair protein RecN [Alphaproteobacteria bacterium]|nr:MAG: DNA repair protein RecN [Alphaproteobacteria bacterium]
MLSHLHITNFLLIKEADIDFYPGFTVITGETGAGKSMVMHAINFICGMKITREIIAPYATKAQVSCTFTQTIPNAVREHLDALDIICMDTLTVRRSLDTTGKSRVFLNDTPVTQQVLKTIAPHFFHIHGQFDTMFDPGSQRDFLDIFAGLQDEVAGTRTAFSAWITLQSALDKRIADQQALHAQADYLIHVLSELDAIKPLANEESDLLATRQKILQRGRLRETFVKIEQLISGENGIYDSINALIRHVDRLVDSFPEMNEHHAGMNIASDHLARLEQTVVQHARKEPTDDDIEHLDERLGHIRNLARKHRMSGDELHTVHEKFTRDLATLQHAEIEEKDLRAQTEKAKHHYMTLARALHKKRVDASYTLRQEMLKELPPLKLEKVDFRIDLTELHENQATSTGVTHVSFMVRTNPGLPFGKLNEIASGGELSRFMLALRVVLRQNNGAQMLVFDEIDAGTGGSVASAIGKRLHRLSIDQQVLAISHAPQVVACAQTHLCLHKTHEAADTQTHIVHLDSTHDRMMEIARMLAGDHITDAAKQAAAELLTKAESGKQEPNHP